MAKSPLRMALLPERLNAVLFVGQVDDSLVLQHLVDGQVLEAIALVDAAADGDPVGLDLEQAGLGKGGAEPLEPDAEIDLAIHAQATHGHAADRTPNRARMVRDTFGVHN